VGVHTAGPTDIPAEVAVDAEADGGAVAYATFVKGDATAVAIALDAFRVAFASAWAAIERHHAEAAAADAASGGKAAVTVERVIGRIGAIAVRLAGCGADAGLRIAGLALEAEAETNPAILDADVVYAPGAVGAAANRTVLAAIGAALATAAAEPVATREAGRIGTLTPLRKAELRFALSAAHAIGAALEFGRCAGLTKAG
jgi:hypothetical protein